MATLTRSSPFAIIALAFCSGIWLASQFSPPIELLVVAIAVSGALAIGAWRYHASTEIIWSVAFAIILISGALRYMLSAPVPASNSIANYNGEQVILDGIVIGEPIVSEDHIELRVKPQSVVSGSKSDSQLADLALVRVDNSITWRYGDAIRAMGLLDAPPQLSAFNYREYLARQDVFSSMPRPDRIWRIGEGNGEWFRARLFDLRETVRRSVESIMPAPESALLNGILIGDDSQIPPDIQEAFRRTGTAHIVAISGFNVSIVIALVVAALSVLLNRRLIALIAIPATLLYIIFVGVSPSVVRAGVMAIIALAGLLFWRKGFTLNTLCAAAFIMVLFDPLTLFDLGFQLSIMATLGLVLYANYISNGVRSLVETRFKTERTRRWTNIAAGVFLVTLAALITTLPLTLSISRQLSLVSLLANVVILPLQPPIMALGAIAAIAGIVSQSIGSLVALPVYALLTATLRIVEWMGSFPFAAVPIYNIETPAVVMYYLLLFAATAVASQPSDSRRTLASRLKSRVGTTVLLFTLLMGFIISGVWWFQRPDGKLHATFSGGGAFIQTPSGKQVVFAGAGNLLSIMGRAMPLWDRAVELVILPQRNDGSRGDSMRLLQSYRIGTIILPDGEDEPSKMLTEWMQTAQANAQHVMTVPMGTRIVLEPNVTLTIEPRAPNRDGTQAIGARLSHGATVIDLVGDTRAISGTLSNGIVFISPRMADANMLNKAKPRWVLWTDTGGGLPWGVESSIRSVQLRDVETIEIVSDGQSFVMNADR